MSKYQLTAFEGEEGPVLSTISTGEEGGPVLTTHAIGEEEPSTTSFRGEEEPVLTTSRTGEEDLMAPGGTDNPFGSF